MEHQQAGADREGVRQQARRPGSRERAAALEGDLQRHEGSAVRGEHERDERKPAAGESDRLRRHVAGRVEDAGGDAE